MNEVRSARGNSPVYIRGRDEKAKLENDDAAIRSIGRQPTSTGYAADR